MGYNTSMRFKGEVRWLEPEEQALYREAKKCLNERYQHYSREVKRLRESWMAIDHLTADSIQQAGWDNPPDREPFYRRSAEPSLLAVAMHSPNGSAGM
jgi:hypothetical protein